VPVFLARRILLGTIVMIGLSLASFCFFASQFPPLKGHPVLPEYWTWLRGLANGNSFHALLFFGHSGGDSLLSKLLPALGHTLVLLGASVILILVFSIAFGAVTAATHGSALDTGLRFTMYLAWAVPAFLLAFIVQDFLTSVGGSYGWGPFPPAGWPGVCPAAIGLNAGTITPCPAAGSGIAYALNVGRYICLPALVLSVGFIGLYGRYIRTSLVAALGSQYAITARAKGLPERTVLLRHAMRNSLITFVAALFSNFGLFFSVAIAVDWVFQLNGLGSAFIREFHPDNGLVDAYSMQLVLLMIGLLVLTASLLGEFVVGLLDPRTTFR
jgi:peptide/nickel transport system permease protein